MSRYKVQNNGRQIENLPARAVLEHEDTPGPVVEALASWRDAVAALAEPREALQVATKAAQDSTLKVRGESARWRAEINEHTSEERAALRKAERVSTVAADALIVVLEEHGSALTAIGARLALAAHADALEAAVDLEDARARFRVGPKVGTHPLVDDVLLSRSRIGAIPEGLLDDLDRVDVAALAERAGESSPEAFGFVERISLASMDSLWTTPRRASLLGRGKVLGANDWTAREDLGVEA